MPIWLVRAGPHGEHQQKFIQEKGVYPTWDGLNVDLVGLSKSPSVAMRRGPMGLGAEVP
jgi:hypothetical protein